MAGLPKSQKNKNQQQISEFEASLVYRTVRAVYREPVSKNKKQTKKIKD